MTNKKKHYLLVNNLGFKTSLSDCDINQKEDYFAHQ